MTQATTKKQERKEAAAAQRKELAAKAKAAQEAAENLEAEMEKFNAFEAQLIGGFSQKNTWMIYVQNPEATECAGFNKWKAAGRIVRKGEKGLKIFAPTKKKVRDEDGNVVQNSKGEDEEEKFFVMVSVFDISQTDPIVEKAES